MRKVLIPIVALLLLGGLLLAANLNKSSNLENSVVSNLDIIGIVAAAPEQDTTIMVVNGIPVGDKPFKALKNALREKDGSLSEKSLDKEAFKILRRNVVAQAEAQRRGIQVSQAEVKEFVEQQRRIVAQLPKDGTAYKNFEKGMKELGFTDANAY